MVWGVFLILSGWYSACIDEAGTPTAFSILLVPLCQQLHLLDFYYF